jgi:hypothetical protein
MHHEDRGSGLVASSVVTAPWEVEVCSGRASVG